MESIDKVIDNANYLLPCQKEKLLSDMEVIESDREDRKAGILSFLADVLSIYESDLSAADNTAIDNWLGR